MTGILQRTFLAIAATVAASACLLGVAHHVMDGRASVNQTASCSDHHCASEGGSALLAPFALMPTTGQPDLSPGNASMPLANFIFLVTALILLASILRKPPNLFNLYSQYRF